MGRRLGSLLLSAAVCLAAAAGCGFFDTRPPVAPTVLPDGLQPKPPTVPENILFNFSNAVQFGIVGQSQLEKTLAEGFRLTFDIADSTELLLGSIDKRITLEAYGLASTADPDSFHFSFEEGVTPEEFGNTAFYNRIGYTFLILTRVAPDSGTVRDTYSGNANIRLATDDRGDWVMVSWDDFNDAAETASWGRFIWESALAVSPSRPRRSATLH